MTIYRHPEWFPDRLIGRAFSTRWVVPQSIRSAERVVCVSSFTAEDVRGRFNIDPTRVSVIPEVIEAPLTINTRLIEEPYFLCVGTMEPRKNFSMACKAFRLWVAQTGSPHRLIFLGKRGWKFAETVEAMNRVRKEFGSNRVREVGYVSDQEKWAWIAHADALLEPSFEEGFGRPIVEAMAVGTPVIASRGGALPEVGGEAVLYADAHDVSAWISAISKRMSAPELRFQYQNAGRDRARQFSRERILQQWKPIIRSAFGERE